MMIKIPMMERKMLEAKSGRQLGLFSRLQAVHLNLPPNTRQKIRSLLAELMSGIKTPSTENLSGETVSRGGQDE